MKDPSAQLGPFLLVSRLERLDLLADGLERDGGSRGRLLDRREGELHREAKRERLEEMGVARSRERNVLLATCRVRGFPRFMTLNRQGERGGRGHCHKKLQNRTEAIQEGSNGNTAERDGYSVLRRSGNSVGEDVVDVRAKGDGRGGVAVYTNDHGGYNVSLTTQRSERLQKKGKASPTKSAPQRVVKRPVSLVPRLPLVSRPVSESIEAR
jgi:hypothetical protein